MNYFTQIVVMFAFILSIVYLAIDVKKTKEETDDLNSLFDSLETKRPNPIGEVYCSYGDEFCDYIVNADDEFYDDNFFKRFKKDDVDDNIDNKIKIFNVWFDKKDVIFYDDIYETKRKTIQRRYKGDK